MGKNIRNSSVILDISNNSTVDITMQTSGRLRCAICKAFDLSQELVDFCQCEDPVHQKCMIQEIDNWIESKAKAQNLQTLKDEKPFTCNQCKRDVFYRAKIEIVCRKSAEILIYVKEYPLISFCQIIFFLIGIGSLILGVLLKLESVNLGTEISPLTISIIAIAIIIFSSLMVLISFYFIFVDILTTRRKRVDKIYQRIKKGQKKPIQLIPVVNLA